MGLGLLETGDQELWTGDMGPEIGDQCLGIKDWDRGSGGTGYQRLGTRNRVPGTRKASGSGDEDRVLGTWRSYTGDRGSGTGDRRPDTIK